MLHFETIIAQLVQVAGKVTGKVVLDMGEQMWCAWTTSLSLTPLERGF